jgi:LPXTG-motif cell wall-anchored protein
MIASSGLVASSSIAADDAAEPTPAPTSAPTVESTPTPEPTATAETAEPAAEGDKKPDSTARVEKRAVSAAAAAAAGDGTLAVTLTQKTGTGPFDADDAAGHDSSADNDIVRTNDTVTYTVGVRFEGEDQTKPTITFTLPKGEELVSLPPFCKDGSSVTPASLPDPAVPVTGTSWQSLPTQTVTCVVADQAQGTALDYAFVSKVRPEVPNGTTLDAVTASATSDQVTTPATSPSVEHTVSAIAQFDVSKRMSSTTANSGAIYQVSTSCSFDSSQTCSQLTYPLTITAPQNGKGIAPLASPITLTDDLTPAAFFGADVWADAIAKAGSESAAIAKYAPRLRFCGGVSGALDNSMPGTSGGGEDDPTAVRDSGSITCAQTGGAGNAVDITITGADTTAYTVPSETNNGTNTLPASTAYVVSRVISLEVPQAAILELGETDGTTFNLTTRNEFTDISMKDIAGRDNIGENPSNNVRQVTLNRRNTGSFDKFFAGIYGTPGNTPGRLYRDGISSWQGPPGSGVVHDGNTVVLDKQLVQSNIVFSEYGVPNSGTTSANTLVGCDVWDESQLALASGDWTGDDPRYYKNNGQPVWTDRFVYGGAGHALSNANTPGSVVQNLKIEYSSGAAGAGASSDCSSGTWYSSPDSVPGSSSSTDANGVKTWTGVNRVRVSFTTDWSGSADQLSLSIAIGQKVKNNGTDTTIPNYASYKRTPGVMSVDDAYADTTTDQVLSNYTPATNAGRLGDRLLLVEAIARINKYVMNPTTGEWTDTAVPQYTSGSNVQYRLDPTLTADVQSGGTTTTLTVEDCLPKYQEFVSSRRAGAGGGSITPVVVQKGAPAGAGISCASDQTYVKWDLGENEIGQLVAPIVVTAEVVDTVRNGTYTNKTLVSSPGDPSPASMRDDDVQIQIVTPTGIKIAKTVDRQIIEVNPKDVAAPRDLTWTVSFANIDAPQNVSNVDVIDVLPSDGLRSSDYEGASTFKSASVASGTGITILYSKNAPTSLSLDPLAATNGGTGATVWCDAASGGSVVSGAGTAADCPSSASEVTGLRFKRAGAFTPDDDFSVKVTTVPTDNAGGDVYENATAGRADGVSQQVGPATRTATVIESAVGNFVWEDVDKDGVQDPDEPGIANFPVKLVGEDLDGNPVSLSTTTNENGAYSFKGLASGTYKVIFDPNALTSNTTFTQRNAGGDDALDSDADTTTGETAEFTLAPDSQDPTWDAGLVIDRNVQIVVDKRVDSQSALDAQRTGTVTYSLTVTNSGTAEGTYSLNDQLAFGGDVKVIGAKASTTASGITVNPTYDGIGDAVIVADQTIAGGATHVYTVTVDVKVATTIATTEADCTVKSTETGTGFLNTAQLAVDDVTYTDKACAPVPGGGGGDDNGGDGSGDSGTPDEGGFLPSTGGPAIGLLLGGLALIAGGAVLVRRRRDESTAEDV